MTAANEELHKQVAVLKRAEKRQAAPFPKGGRSSRPKRPGRKPGMGSFGSYAVPDSLRVKSRKCHRLRLRTLQPLHGVRGVAQLERPL